MFLRVELIDFVELFLQKEHLAIREKRRPEDPIEWNDLKSMRFTRAVRIKACNLKAHVML